MYDKYLKIQKTSMPSMFLGFLNFLYFLTSNFSKFIGKFKPKKLAEIIKNAAKT